MTAISVTSLVVTLSTTLVFILGKLAIVIFRSFFHCQLTNWSIMKTGRKIGVYSLHPGAAGPFVHVSSDGSRQSVTPRGRLFAMDSSGRHLLTCSPTGGMIYRVCRRRWWKCFQGLRQPQDSDMNRVENWLIATCFCWNRGSLLNDFVAIQNSTDVIRGFLSSISCDVQKRLANSKKFHQYFDT